MTVGIIDYGVGNIGSLQNMFFRLEVDASFVTDPAALTAYDHVVLPGVGAFDVAAAELQRTGFDDAVRAYAATGKQLLGICLGMQLLLDSSEEGVLSGLGLISGSSVRFDPSMGLRVPHLGWAQIRKERDHPIVADLPDDHRFYFAHSYHVKCADESNVLASTEYGARYASMICADSVTGAQFHPEKSHRFGMQMLKEWVQQ